MLELTSTLVQVMGPVGTSREKFAFIVQSMGPTLPSVVPISRYTHTKCISSSHSLPTIDLLLSILSAGGGPEGCLSQTFPHEQSLLPVYTHACTHACTRTHTHAHTPTAAGLEYRSGMCRRPLRSRPVLNIMQPQILSSWLSNPYVRPLLSLYIQWLAGWHGVIASPTAYRFFPLLMLASVVVVCVLGRDFGPMLSAELHSTPPLRLSESDQESEDVELVSPSSKETEGLLTG